MIKKVVFLNLFIFLSLSLKAQNIKKVDGLIAKIKGDVIWNFPKYSSKANYFISYKKTKDIDKISLLLLSSSYYSKVDKVDKAIDLLNQAEFIRSKILESDSLKALISMKKSGCYASIYNYSESYKEWVKANNYYVLTSNYLGMSYTQQILAIQLSKLDQKEASIEAFKKAEKYALKVKNEKALYDLNVNIAAFWLNEGQYDKALKFLKKSTEYYDGKSQNDLLSDNIKAAIYLNKGDVLNARFYFNELINNAIKSNCVAYSRLGYYGLAVSYINEDENQAIIYLKKALSIIGENNPDLSINICECVLDNFSESKQTELIAFFSKSKLKFKEIESRNDKIQVGEFLKISNEISGELLKTQVSLKKQSEIESKNILLIYLLLVVGVFLTILLIITYTIIKRKKINQAKLKKEFDNQKALLNQSLIRITNFNAISENLSEKLKKIALNQGSKKLSDELYLLVKQIDGNALGIKSKELKDLDLTIQSINEGFVQKLCKTYKDLTSNEITLAIYLRMNFSTKQIAELKGTSENSIDVARSRLRKKLGINKDNIDLVLFMNKI